MLDVFRTVVRPFCDFLLEKIKGKNNKTNVHHLKDGHDTLTSEQDISNKLGQIFSQNSSTQNYDPEFKMDIVGATCSVMRLIQRFSQFI
jgi:hypothetical protein